MPATMAAPAAIELRIAQAYSPARVLPASAGKEQCAMRKLFLVLLSVLLTVACNRDAVERTETADTGATTTVSGDTAPSTDTTVTMTGTSATAPIAATGTEIVTPTETSSTIVTPTTTTASMTSPTETSSTVVTTTTRR
jgi:hypothetical protein